MIFYSLYVQLTAMVKSECSQTPKLPQKSVKVARFSTKNGRVFGAKCIFDVLHCLECFLSKPAISYAAALRKPEPPRKPEYPPSRTTTDYPPSRSKGLNQRPPKTARTQQRKLSSTDFLRLHFTETFS